MGHLSFGENFPFLVKLVFRWQGSYTDCSDLFKLVKTDDGFCCSFNSISVQSSYAAEVGQEEWLLGRGQLV